jgi:hypothetical protein
LEVLPLVATVGRPAVGPPSRGRKRGAQTKQNRPGRGVVGVSAAGLKRTTDVRGKRLTHGEREGKGIEAVEEDLVRGEVAIVALSIFDESEDASDLEDR